MKTRNPRALFASAAALACVVALAGCESTPAEPVYVGLAGPSGAAAVLPAPVQTYAERTGGLLPHERFEYDRNDGALGYPSAYGLPAGAYPVYQPWERPVLFHIWEQ